MTISLDIQSGVAAATYDDLIALVAAYLNRTDLNARIPALIELAERRFNRTLTTPEREVDEITTVTGDMELPGDFYQLVSVYLATDSKRPLQQVTPQALREMNLSNTPGLPMHFALSAGFMKFGPSPDGPYDLHFTYIRKIELLGVNVPANWLLEKHPDIYLYGTLVQAEAFLNNDERIQLWKGALDEALQELVDMGNRMRYSAAPLRMRSPVCV